MTTKTEKPELSTKWYNVIRRQMRAVQPTEHDVQCPDCGSPMWLTAGRWGRFYSCPHYECDGTRGARLDGTPRRERGSPEEIAARHRTRDVIHQVTLIADHSDGDGEILMIGSLSIRHDPFEVILKASGVNPFAKVTRTHVKGWGFVDVRRRKPGLDLKNRSIEDCEKIRQAAIEYLRKNRNNAWDRLACDGPSIEAAE